MPPQSDRHWWNKHYFDKNTPWDIGGIAPPLQAFFDSLSDSNLRILIPGAGKGHEAIYLHRRGFQNVFVCDWATDAFHFLLEEEPEFPEDHLLCSDFFKLNLEVDLLIEQTFFCAIDPSLRPQYAQKAAELLVPGGRLVGLLFANPFPADGPPFGGTKEEYARYFEAYFSFSQFEIASNSIKPRAGNELFINFIKL